MTDLLDLARVLAQKVQANPDVAAALVVYALAWFTLGWTIRHMTWHELITRQRRRAFKRGLAEGRGEADEQEHTAYWKDLGEDGERVERGPGRVRP